jgi:hypothetical protein
VIYKEVRPVQTISIGTIASPTGDRLYRAASGDRQSTGKTAGAALDALTAQMETQEIEGFLLLQTHQPDRFFTAQQQQRLTELMSLWRNARDVGDSFPSDLQSELDALIEAELDATAARSQAILAQIQP